MIFCFPISSSRLNSDTNSITNLNSKNNNGNRNAKYELLVQSDANTITLEQNTSKLENLQNQLLVLDNVMNNFKNKQEKDFFALQLCQSQLQECKLKLILQSEKIQELENRQNNLQDQNTIITRDMEGLLNNDKLLLDKLIEKNIVSTIQEENQIEDNYDNYNDNSEPASIYKSTS